MAEEPALKRRWLNTESEVPVGVSARIRANIEALKVIRQAHGAPLDNDQWRTVSAWSSWGGLSDLFDEDKDRFGSERNQLKELLGQEEYENTRKGVLYAHYTDPYYISAIWRALEKAGVEQGIGLEPGCGSGAFIGHAPQGVSMIGIEIDEQSATIAQALNPEEDIRHEGYEETVVPGGVDFAVGNVPFGDVKLYDPVFNEGRHSIHNHFIVKALNQAREGGYVAVLTSAFTLDAINPSARRDMYERADLISAVRLPSGAHARMANTQVVSDILVFRVRKAGEEPQPFTWERATKRDIDGRQIAINDYFSDNPTHVLGTITSGSGQFGRDVLAVSGNSGSELGKEISSLLEADIERAKEKGLSYDPQVREEKIEVDLSDKNLPLGALRVENGVIESNTVGGWSVLDVPKTRQEELKELIYLMENVQVLIELEATTPRDSPGLESIRSKLRQQYEAYVQKYEALNRNTRKSVMRKVKNSDGSEEFEERISVVRPPVMKYVRKDPRSAALFSIERYDDVTEKAQPASILLKRQVHAPYVAKGADNPRDGLAICMTQKGEIDFDYISYLVGQDVEEVKEALKGEIFNDPKQGLVTREEYLSGNVRIKLNQAREAGAGFEQNIEALEKVIPEDIPISDISVEIGVNWIPVKVYETFLQEMLGNYRLTVSQGAGEYKIDLHGGGRTSYEQVTQYGTEDMCASQIFKTLLNANEVVVYETIDKKRVVNPEATDKAKAQAEKMQNFFASWIWKDTKRAKMIQDIYNFRFNALVARSYEQAGKNLVLPGLSDRYILRDHQRTAIARMIAEPTVGLFHEVGAGKTLEMVCGVMEQKRLGLVNKPMVVVPNHLLGQFGREWLQAYPKAKILLADMDSIGKKENREAFFAQVLSSDWDAIICTQNAFAKIPVSIESLTDYRYEQLKRFDEAIKINADDKDSVRKLEDQRLKAEQRIKAEIDQVAKQQDDSVLTFEKLGVDYLVLDEAHAYKNLSIPSKLARRGKIIAEKSSKRCSDLDMKLGILRKEYGERVVTLATATPVANALGEMWVMMHYLRPQVLEDAGVDNFDAWAKTFAVEESKAEIKPTGEYKFATRFSRYQNVPELLSMWLEVGDVKLSEDLHLDVPELFERADGLRKAEVVTVNIGSAMEQFQERILERAEDIEHRVVPPNVDNYLTLTGDGKAFATDYRLVSEKRKENAFNGVDIDSIGEQKLDKAAQNIFEIYEQNINNEYKDENGDISEIKGAFQIVFLDQGTPGGSGWNAYEELKRLLIEKGMPAEKIAFAHDAKDSVEKDKLFAKCRTGAISVLIGSTEKMGTGANMQDRAIALHHIDVPWRPADMIQRLGRIIRQGNQNPFVHVYRYVTEGSMDAYLWQTLENKIRFITQIMRGIISGREVDEIGGKTMDYAEVKAIAKGDPRLIDLMNLGNEYKTLNRRQTQFEAGQKYLEEHGRELEQMISHTTRYLAELQNASASMRDVTGEKFNARIHNISETDRKNALELLAKEFARATHDYPQERMRDNLSRLTRNIDEYRYPFYNMNVEIGGLKILFVVLRQNNTKQPFEILAVPESIFNKRYMSFKKGAPRFVGSLLSIDEIYNPTLGTIRKLENAVMGLPKYVEAIKEYDRANRAELDKVRQDKGQTSPHLQRLKELESTIKALEAEIAGDELNKPVANISQKVEESEPKRSRGRHL